MPSLPDRTENHMKAFIRSRPVASYYGALLLISWGLFAIVVGPSLARGEPMRPMHAFIMFPLLVLSVAVCGWWWTKVTESGSAENLWRRVRRWRVGFKWYLVAFGLPPAAILTTLGVLGAVSPHFHHGFFGWGVLFGLVPGVLEEMGWMGYLFPQLQRQFRPFPGALILGVLWACWHLPVVNFLGAAGPHGAWFLPFFLAFAAVLMAMRVIMVWVYCRTGSVLLMQLMHASSTGSLVLLGPSHVTSRDEAIWYGAYAILLWSVVTVVATVLRRSRPGAIAELSLKRSGVP